MIVREKRARDKGNGGRLGGIVKPRGHGFIVEGDNVFQCVGVRPGTNSEFFEEIWMMVACLTGWHI